jgi:TPR repeat protein
MPNPKIALEALQKGHDAIANQDQDEAITQYTIAAQLGNNEAKNALGFFKFVEAKKTQEDQQTGENYRAAFAYFLETAKAGDAEGCYRAGGCYDKGFGTPVNELRANYFHMLAGSMGHYYGQQRAGAFLAKKTDIITQELIDSSTTQSKTLEELKAGLIDEQDYLVQQVNQYIYKNVIRKVQNNLVMQLIALLDTKAKKITVNEINKLFKPLKMVCLLESSSVLNAKNHLKKVPDRFNAQSIQDFKKNLPALLTQDLPIRNNTLQEMVNCSENRTEVSNRIEQTRLYFLKQLHESESFSDNSAIQLAQVKSAVQNAAVLTSLLDIRDRAFGIRCNDQLFESLAIALGIEFDKRTLELLTEIEGVLYNNPDMFYHNVHGILSSTTLDERKKLHYYASYIIDALKEPAHEKMKDCGYQAVLTVCSEIIFAIEYQNTQQMPALISSILTLSKEALTNTEQWPKVFVQLMEGPLKEPFRYLSTAGEIDVIAKAARWFIRSMFDEKIGIKLEPAQIDFICDNESQILDFIGRFCRESLTSTIKDVEHPLKSGQEALKQGAVDEAEQCFIVAANRGSFAGHYHLGIIAQQNAKLKQEDPRTGETYIQAFELFSEAVMASYEPAFNQAGKCYQHGLGIEKKPKLAGFFYMQGELFGDQAAAQSIQEVVNELAKKILALVKTNPSNLEKSILTELDSMNIEPTDYLSRQHNLLLKARVLNATLLLLKSELLQANYADPIRNAVEILLSQKVKSFEAAKSNEEHKQIKFDLFILTRKDHQIQCDEFEKNVLALFPVSLKKIEVKKIIEEVCVRLMNSLRKCDRSTSHAQVQASLSLIKLLEYCDKTYGIDLRQGFFKSGLSNFAEGGLSQNMLLIFDELECVPLNKSDNSYKQICHVFEKLDKSQIDALLHLLIVLSYMSDELQKITSYFLMAIVRFEYDKTKTMPLLVQELIMIPESVFADDKKWQVAMQPIYDKLAALGHFKTNSDTIELSGYATWYIAAQQKHFPEVAQVHRDLIARNADRMVRFLDEFVAMVKKQTNGSSASSSTNNGVNHMQNMVICTTDDSTGLQNNYSIGKTYAANKK